ncbi:MAG: DUF692 family multinuclear iron-containing protein [Spirochaetota bacterium]
MQKNLIGLGLRTEHFNYLLKKPKTGIGWFEIITENFTDTGGAPLYVLEQLRKDYPVAFHGVALSIGSVNGVSLKHLHRIRELSERIEPFQVSDHFCFARFGDRQYHELLPLPRTQAMAERVIRNISRVQEYLKRQLVLENISAYLEYPHNDMSEAEFINYIAEKSGCGVLLDINNVYVNAANFRYNARRAILAFDPKHVVQYHLAGFTDLDTHLFDTHAEAVHAPVRQLFRETRYHLGERRFSVERDDKIPTFGRLERETLSLAALSPQQMPKRFLSPAPGHLPAGDFRTRRGLQRETDWQRRIYDKEGSRAERSAGSLTVKAARKVYRNAYDIRFTGALRDKFKHLADFLPEPALGRLFAAYVQDTPSVHEDLGAYGASLPHFLKKKLPQRSYLADAARLDLLRYELFHRTVRPAKKDILRQKVKLQGACLWQSNYTLFAGARNGRLHKAPGKPQKKAQYAIVYRKAFAVHERMLSTAQYDLVTALESGARIPVLVAQAEAKGTMTASEIKQLFEILGLEGVLA